MTTRTETTIDQIVEHFLALDFEGLLEHYDDDIFVDLNVPQWRLQAQGREQLGQMFAGGYPVGARLASSRVRSMAEGVAIEVEVRFPEEGEERLFRELHLLTVDGGRVVEHTAYCTGHWDAATIARHAEEAPMIRP